MESECCEIFKVLGVETRLKIIELLKNKGPLGANKIAKMLDISPAAVSQHLKILRHAGFVKSKRKGYRIPYSIVEEGMEHCRVIVSEVCECGCQDDVVIEVHHKKHQDLKSLKNIKKNLEKELEKINKAIKNIETKKG